MSSLPTNRTPLPRLLAACSCATALSLSAALGALSPAAAQDSAPPERLTPAQKEKIFPERKALLLKQQQERMTIQQKGQRCTEAAKNQQALRGCMTEERKAYQQLRSQYREEMRKIYERHGIKAPVGGPGKGSKGSKGGAEA
jgi:Spy/CpxP family protein refolding chaperone